MARPMKAYANWKEWRERDLTMKVRHGCRRVCPVLTAAAYMHIQLIKDIKYSFLQASVNLIHSQVQHLILMTMMMTMMTMMMMMMMMMMMT